MKIFDRDKNKEVISVSNAILEALENHDINSEIIYSALGYAFSEMHFKLGKNIRDWERITGNMTEIFNLRGEK